MLNICSLQLIIFLGKVRQYTFKFDLFIATYVYLYESDLSDKILNEKIVSFRDLFKMNNDKPHSYLDWLIQAEGLILILDINPINLIIMILLCLCIHTLYLNK